MSRHHYTHQEVGTLEHDVQHLPARELETLYGIEFMEHPGQEKKGPVLDTVTGKVYPALADWMIEQAEQDVWSEAEHHQISRRFDEEF